MKGPSAIGLRWVGIHDLALDVWEAFRLDRLQHAWREVGRQYRDLGGPGSKGGDNNAATCAVVESRYARAGERGLFRAPRISVLRRRGRLTYSVRAAYAAEAVPQSSDDGNSDMIG